VDADEARVILGVSKWTDLAGARAAYRERVRCEHPDLSPGDRDGAHARTARLTEAYEVLVAWIGSRDAQQPIATATRPPTGAAPRHGSTPPPAPPDEGSFTLAASWDGAWVLLYEAASRVGHVAYKDRHLGILEIIVRFEGGPSCSVVLTLEELSSEDPLTHSGTGPRTTVSCAIESIEATPAPPVAPVVEALIATLTSL
jgi:hypothetical protein